MNTRRFAILACLISLLLHVWLIFLAGRISLSGSAFDAFNKKDAVAEQTKYRKIHLKKTPDPQRPAEGEKDPFEPEWEDGSEFNVPEFEDLHHDGDKPQLKALEEQDELLKKQTEEVRKILDEHTAVEPPVDLYQLQPIPDETPAISSPAAIAFPKEALEVTAPRPEILAINAQHLAPERLTDARTTTPLLDREFVPDNVQLPSLAIEGVLSGPAPVPRLTQVQLQAGRPQFALSDSDLAGLLDDDSSPLGNLPELSGGIPEPSGSGAFGNVKIGDNAAQAAYPLDDYVSVQVSTYPDPAGPGGTFLVEIRPGPRSDAMEDIPKDVLFIIDRSSSISVPKFNQFKRAIQEVLPALSSSDRFNVISFNDKQSAIFREFVPGNAANIKVASDRVGSLPHGGRTDVFGGVAPFVKKSNGDRNRPLNIFLLTDGQSTVNVYEPSEFLKQVSGINPGNVSIFPFSAERKANRMLLDFLGYLNKGEKCHVETTDEIRDAMVRFYSDHASLLITDMRCAATRGANVNEIFPRSLPHLYRNQTLRLFGRYEDRADTLTLSITGRDASGRLRDLIFSRRLSECPAASPTLPSQWAGQKILFLLSRMNISNNPGEQASLRERIEALKKQYSILSPY